MRKSVIAAVVIGAFAAAACTSVRSERQKDSAPAARTPEQIAADAVKPGFAGQQSIGAWTLVCGRIPQGTAPTPAGSPVTTNVINRNGQKFLNVTVRVPPRPCKVVDVLEQADKPERRTVATFSLRGPYGVLFLAFRTRQELFPGKLERPIQPAATGKPAEGGKQTTMSASDDSTAEFVSLDYDGKTLKGPLIVCGPNACIADIRIPRDDEPGLLAAKHIALELPAFPGKPPLRIDVPVLGLAEAIGAMRRMEK